MASFVAPPAASTEDAANDSGEAIATFSGYVPTALPPSLIPALSGANDETIAVPFSRSNPSSPLVQQQDDTCSNVVIDLVESSCDSFAVEKEDGESAAALEFKSLGIPSHTSPACESALLASVSAPRASNESCACLLPLARSRALSPLQLEGVSLAITRHNRLLYYHNPSEPAGRAAATIRAGFFMGDAAGIGKGRQIAAVLLDSLHRGRTRHLWVSVSRELQEDAKRDLRDLGCTVPVHDGVDALNMNSKKGLGAGGSIGKGILFITYSLLVSGQGKRMEELIQWLSGGSTTTTTAASSTANQHKQRSTERAFAGVLVFDEAHKAKNLDADTFTAKLVIQLQERLAHARVLYCSATGVSDIKHMVYANRLGLWGAGSPLYPTFDTFQQTLSHRGMGSLELLALEMKQMGSFVARTLSWDGAEFETLEIPLNASQVSMYDAAVQWWFLLEREIKAALHFLGDVAPPKTLWRAYWSAHQRFFREMAICAKVSRVVQESLHHLEQGRAIVIGLQSTGEASTQTALEELATQILLDSDTGTMTRGRKMNYEEILLPSLVSTARSVMTGFVQNHFPVALPPMDVPKIPPIPPDGFPDEQSRLLHARLQDEAERIRAMPPPEAIEELVAKRQALMDATRQLNLPPNPLDDLIDQLGGENQVAELTGRSGRILRYKNSQDFHYVRRIQEKASNNFGLSIPKSNEDFDKLNITEKKKFMDGRKSVAIISDAASTGISLHAAKGSGAAHKRRVHFTIELPWAADKAIQQLGRSHRSGQLSAPIYKMVVTELGGERRFGAAVAKRMANLGALTKGDRRAATGSDLSEFDIDSVYGRRALARVYQCLLVGGDDQIPTTIPSRRGNAILEAFAQQSASSNPVIQAMKLDEEHRRGFALLRAKQALDDVGLSSKDTGGNKAEVKVFLNRIAGLPVLQQKLIFSLFMSTLDDVVSDAKSTGEFEGGVEDVKATNIRLDRRPEYLAIDKRSGASTTLTRFNVDRGISLDTVATQSLEDAAPETIKDDSQPTNVAESGYYLSKRTIAGRQLILYAKRKVESDTETGNNTHDPLGLMVVTRPNTGKNPCEMSTRDLHLKYNLLLSSNEFSHMLEASKRELVHSDAEPSPLGPAVILRSKFPKVAELWDRAYNDSDCFNHNQGLAPRRSQLGLITGAVLHILPALEKAVMLERQSVRALRVTRAEITSTGERIVGIRFPLDKEIVEKLKSILLNLSNIRQGLANVSFQDEAFTPIDASSMAWATTEPKTMRSFFNTSASAPKKSNTTLRPNPSSLKQKVTDSQGFVPFSPHGRTNSTTSSTHKRSSTSSSTTSNKSAKSSRSTASIASFFVKK